MKKYGLSNFLKIAHANINGDTETLEGLQTRLVSWFCFEYNTTPNDNRLLEMTLEELIVLYQMHRVKKDPKIMEELDPQVQNYEDWLKKEMGEDYLSDDEMVEGMDKEEQEYTKKIRDQFPDRVDTDFSQFNKE